MQDLKNLDCLLLKTKTLLLKMIDGCAFLEKYVLVGGSALTLHLCHRKSEDLDFFTYEDSFDRKEIFEYLEPIEVVDTAKIRDFFEQELNNIKWRIRISNEYPEPQF